MSVERVREYLLGQLSDPEAAQVEARYFADADYLRLVEANERQLISDYLDGRLPAAERELFESRYTKAPVLKQKLEAVRRERAEGRFRWRALAVAATVTAVVLSAWVYSRARPVSSQQVAEQQPERSAPVVALFLAPGIQRGETDAPTASAPAGSSVRLTLELPGLRSARPYTVRIHRVGSDPGDAPLWSTATPTTSRSAESGQAVEIVLAPASLSPDDYIVEARSVDGNSVERYVFRLVP